MVRSFQNMVLALLLLLVGAHSVWSYDYNDSEIRRAPNGVAYRVSLPGDYDETKEYFLFIALGGGTDRLEWRLASLGDMKSQVDGNGPVPIFAAIDFGNGDGKGNLPAAGDPLYEGFAGVIAHLTDTYPLRQQVFATGWCFGGCFLTHYHVKYTQDNRLVAIVPTSSNTMAYPEDGSKSSVKFLFTCGTRDGAFAENVEAAEKYSALGYEASMYADQGVGHTVTHEVKMERWAFFSAIADSISSVTPVLQVRSATRSGTRGQSRGPTKLLGLDGRVVSSPFAVSPALYVHMRNANSRGLVPRPAGAERENHE